MKLNSNLLDVTIHFTDNEDYYSYTISEIYDPSKADFFKQFFNYDPIVCDVTCKNDLVSGVIHDYLDSDYIFEILEETPSVTLRSEPPKLISFASGNPCRAPPPSRKEA